MLFLKTIRVTSVFEADKVAQLFTPFVNPLQAIFIFVINVVPIFLLVAWMTNDPFGREKITR